MLKTERNSWRESPKFGKSGNLEATIHPRIASLALSSLRLRLKEGLFKDKLSLKLSKPSLRLRREGGPAKRRPGESPVFTGENSLF